MDKFCDENYCSTCRSCNEKLVLWNQAFPKTSGVDNYEAMIG
jgi:hypothetical protein